MDLVRLPRRFLDDHDERLCDAEDVPLVVRVRETARYAWVAHDDTGLADLINDAEHYADADEWSEDAESNAALRPLAQAARRLLATLKVAGVA